LPIAQKPVRTMEDIVGESVSQRRFKGLITRHHAEAES
jgi:hypothetical protein